jgi:hypothetical protein
MDRDTTPAVAFAMLAVIEPVVTPEIGDVRYAATACDATLTSKSTVVPNESPRRRDRFKSPGSWLYVPITAPF